MDPTFAISSAISSLAVVLSIGIVGWSVVAFTRARHGKTDTPHLPSTSLQPLEARLDRLEQATEAIAQQVERIAEGQRFVTKLLSEDGNVHARLPAP